MFMSMLAALVMTMMTKTMMTMSKKSIVVSPPDKPPLGLSISCSSTTMFFLPNDPPDLHDHHAVNHLLVHFNVFLL